MSDIMFTEEEERYIKNRFKLNNDQLEVFLLAAKRYNLNPITNQIYPQVRGSNMTVTTGIDGFRLIADRTRCYAGNDDPIYDNEEDPKKATVTVYKIVGGARCPFTASARWEQYFPGERQGFMWKKMPHLMLGKCAESLALRKAFPAELSGLYTQEEMQQAKSADNGVVVEVEPPTPQREVPAQEEETAKQKFMSLVKEWANVSVPADLFDCCKFIMSDLGYPTDGSAVEEDFVALLEHVETITGKGRTWQGYKKQRQEMVDVANEAAGSDVWE